MSALIDGVKGGASVLITDRGRPVARLAPVMGAREPDDSRRARLIREGIIRPGRGKISPKLLSEIPPRLDGEVSALQALLEERREGR